MIDTDPHGVDQHVPGAKLDAGKLRYSLILHSMPNALAHVTRVGMYGAEKYSVDGWMQVQDGIQRYTDAMFRHALAEPIHPIDAESGLPHAAQVAWNALARLELMLRERGGSIR